MKIKKIITAASCAALIAAAALPLTACGSGSLKTSETLNISDYVEQYRPNGVINDVYERDAVSVRQVPRSSFNYGSTANVENNIAVIANTVGSSTYYYAYNTICGAEILSNVGELIHQPSSMEYSFDFDQDGMDDLTFSVLITTYAEKVGGEQKVKNDVYTWDGKVIAQGLETLELNGIDFSLSQNKIKTSVSADKLFNVVTVRYTKGENEIVDYYSADESEYDMVYFTKHEKENIVFVDPLVDVGSSIFSAIQPLNRVIAALNGDTSFKEIQGDLAAYSVGAPGNDMVFYKDGEEAGRVNLDCVDEDQVAFAGNYMYYVKRTAVPKTDKNANLIINEYASELRFNYELHRYDIVKKKDKKLSYNVAIDSLKSVYNNKSKTYDALVVSGAKLKNNVYQSANEFTYVTDAELKVNYDVTQVGGFDIAKVSSIGSGNYLLEKSNSYTVLDGNFKVISEFTNSHYYKNMNLFSFVKDGRTGFAKPDGTVAIEPIYTNAVSGQFMTFYNGYTVANNQITGKKVVLNSSNGQEEEMPTDDFVKGISVDIANLSRGWFTVRYTGQNGDNDRFVIRTVGGGGTSVDNYKSVTSKSTDNMLEFRVGNGTTTLYNMYVIDSARWTHTITL